MKKLLAAAMFAVILLASSPAANAARPGPTGAFALSPAPYHEGGTITFTITDLQMVKPSYEVTIGVWCVLPDGTGIPWGNRNNPYIYEFNSFGTTALNYPQTLDLPAYGTGYSCTSQMIAADWFKGQVRQAWTLDTHYFSVAP